MTAPNFIPPVDRTSDREHDEPQMTVLLSPPLAAIVASVEAARANIRAMAATAEAQLDSVLAQVNAVAYTGAAINNARGGRTRPAGENAGMPATFGARPSSRAAASPSAGEDNANERQPNVEQRDDGQRAERAIERL